MIDLLVALALATGSQEQGPPDCVRSYTLAFEVSGEPAGDVADAVAIACDITREQVHPDSPLGRASLETREQISQLGRRLTKDLALVLVIRIRTCRRTAGCDINTVH